MRSEGKESINRGAVVVVKWLSGHLEKERKIVEDALARNQERKSGSIEEAANEKPWGKL